MAAATASGTGTADMTASSTSRHAAANAVPCPWRSNTSSRRSARSHSSLAVRNASKAAVVTTKPSGTLRPVRARISPRRAIFAPARMASPWRSSSSVSTSGSPSVGSRRTARASSSAPIASSAGYRPAWTLPEIWLRFLTITKTSIAALRTRRATRSVRDRQARAGQTVLDVGDELKRRIVAAQDLPEPLVHEPERRISSASIAGEAVRAWNACHAARSRRPESPGHRSRHAASMSVRSAGRRLAGRRRAARRGRSV